MNICPIFFADGIFFFFFANGIFKNIEELQYQGIKHNKSCNWFGRSKIPILVFSFSWVELSNLELYTTWQYQSQNMINFVEELIYFLTQTYTF